MIAEYLGKFSATARRAYDDFCETFVWNVTIYDRHDTSVVSNRQYTDLSVITLRAMLRQAMRNLSTKEVAAWDSMPYQPNVIAVAYNADLHCLLCARDDFGRQKVAWVMAVSVTPDNVVALLDNDYPQDNEGNAVTRYTVDEAQEYYRQDGIMPCCGDCFIPLLDKNEYAIEN